MKKLSKEQMKNVKGGDGECFEHEDPENRPICLTCTSDSDCYVGKVCRSSISCSAPLVCARALYC